MPTSRPFHSLLSLPGSLCPQIARGWIPLIFQGSLRDVLSILITHYSFLFFLRCIYLHLKWPNSFMCFLIYGCLSLTLDCQLHESWHLTHPVLPWSYGSNKAWERVGSGSITRESLSSAISSTPGEILSSLVVDFFG
jgi:hypothetical protein